MSPQDEVGAESAGQCPCTVAFLCLKDCGDWGRSPTMAEKLFHTPSNEEMMWGAIPLGT